jgi:hypothetical protein
MPRYDDDSDLEPRPRRRRPPPRPRRESSTALVLVGVGSALLLFVAGVGVAAYLVLREQAKDRPGGGLAGTTDLERLAGTWECTFRDPTGRVYMRKVKQIVGNTETATWYQPDDRVFRINRVEFQLTERGPDKVFRYFNGWATDGNGLGRHPFPPGEYVYTLEGDTWTEYDPAGAVLVWTRRR